MSEQLRVLFLAPEMVPFVKTGGLADVAGALPGALCALGAEVRAVLPDYRPVRQGAWPRERLFDDLEVPFGRESLLAKVDQTSTPSGVPLYLLDREELYDRPSLYNSSLGDYYDNFERFTFWVRAALALCEKVGFKPDIIHAHDWQAGLAPALARTLFPASRSVLTIHNLGYQGLFPLEKFPFTGLDPREHLHVDGMEYWGQLSLLKSAINEAHAITTVSPTYAREILLPDQGMGMDGILRHRERDLVGILNGADYGTWNPATDPYLPAHYELTDRAGKAACKKALLEELHLDPLLNTRPLLAMISRLVRNKGANLVAEAVDEIARMGAGLVVLGLGDPTIQASLRAAAERHPGRVALILDYNDPMAHRIYAGADLFLVPSEYEPCGLTQMYAMRYGTLPIVRTTGGLADTVRPFGSDGAQANGFRFDAFTTAALIAAIRQAVDLHHRPALWETLVETAMKADFSWERSARRTLELFERVLVG